MVSFACTNLHHYILENKYNKKSLSKTTSGDSGGSFSHMEHNRSSSPSRNHSRSNNTIGSDEGRVSNTQSTPSKFVFKKDL